MVPFFPRIMENLKMYLIEEQSDETLCLQIQSVGKSCLFNSCCTCTENVVNSQTILLH